MNGGDFLMMLLKCVQITIHHAVLRAHLHGIKKLQTVLRYRKYKYRARTAALFNHELTYGKSAHGSTLHDSSVKHPRISKSLRNGRYCGARSR